MVNVCNQAIQRPRLRNTQNFGTRNLAPERNAKITGQFCCTTRGVVQPSCARQWFVGYSVNITSFEKYGNVEKRAVSVERFSAVETLQEHSPDRSQNKYLISHLETHFLGR